VVSEEVLKGMMEIIIYLMYVLSYIEYAVDDIEEELMNLSYQEKLVWGQFLPMVILFGYYFFRLARGAGAGSLVGVLIGIAVLQVVCSILVAALAKKEPRDERDRLIAYKAFKVAYLATICVGICGMWIAFEGGRESVGRQLLTNWALAFLIGAEMVRTGTMLVLHRTSVTV
jgi:hypothetical protein